MRGYVDGDRRDFSPDALGTLSKAACEASYLVDHGYPRDTVMAFVGNRYQFTERQRLLLARTVSGTCAADSRQRRCLPFERLAGTDVSIDGFNAVVTLEVALSGGPVLLCQDGTVRDLAGLKGTYHIIDQTSSAIDLILAELDRHHARSARFLLDAPVSNSGQLRALIEQRGAESPIEVDVEMAGDVDGLLYGCENVITSDSIVLDRCASWFNLDARIVKRLEGTWLIATDFDEAAPERAESTAEAATPVSAMPSAVASAAQSASSTQPQAAREEA